MKKQLFFVCAFIAATSVCAFNQEVAGININYPAQIEYSEAVTTRDWQQMDLEMQRSIMNYQVLVGPPAGGFDYIMIYCYVFHDHINIGADPLILNAEAIASQLKYSNPSLRNAETTITPISQGSSPRAILVELTGEIQDVLYGASVMVFDLPSWNVRWIVAVGYYDDSPTVAFESQQDKALSLLQGISFVQ